MTIPEMVALSAGSLLVGFGVAWGTLKSQVKGTEEAVKALGEKMETRHQELYSLLRDCSQRIANIEGWRNGKCQ